MRSNASILTVLPSVASQSCLGLGAFEFVSHELKAVLIFTSQQFLDQMFN